MPKLNVKTIFFGTSEFAIPALEALIKEGYKITAVITNPDEPVGRKKVLTPPPIKIVAQKLGLLILQPEKLRNNPEFVEQLKNLLNAKRSTLNAGIGIIAAYGKIVPAEIINLSPFGILNIHPSLLPKYRGPTPIQSTILNGEKETGVTIIKIDEEIDHGPIIATSQWPIANSETYKELEGKLAKLGAELLIKILPAFLAGKIKPRPQDHLRATFTRKFTRDDAKIDWNKTAEEINRQVRALNPEPGTWTMWNSSKVLKIIEAKLELPVLYAFSHDRGKMHTMESAGKVFLENGEVKIKTARGNIILKTVQLEGRKAMPAENFARGNRNFIGAVLE